MRYLGIDGKNEEYPVHYEVLSGLSLLISRSGKNRKTEVVCHNDNFGACPQMKCCIAATCKYAVEVSAGNGSTVRCLLIETNNNLYKVAVRLRDSLRKVV